MKSTDGWGPVDLKVGRFLMNNIQLLNDQLITSLFSLFRVSFRLIVIKLPLLLCVCFSLKKLTSETSLFVVIPVGSVLNRRPVNVSISYIPTENKSLQCQDDFTIQKPDFLRLTSVPVTNTKSARDGYKKRTFSFSDILDTPSGKYCIIVFFKLAGNQLSIIFSMMHKKNEVKLTKKLFNNIILVAKR